MKVFTILYVLVGIGVLVEILRRFAVAYIAVRSHDRPRGPEPDSAA